ncbi:MAG TPA: amidohydrolase [Bacillus bacterium]|uniref:Amidohydrolase YtcJ n=1 Tax=Siminovitchia fordii TaxID=254759 RepID=A0ABQ4K7Y1_9BACI|nr:amidohydrolase [Siminovitchia fordii]GIN21844.1 putative amidohydrolase YtcJ [Siminovitchia fordii]HBZ11729.1 amidohydrolase [Bacillus sp. (in: firmicutes)]
MTKIIFTNGNVYTFDKSKPVVESVVVENGKIVDLGSDEDMMLQWGREGTVIVDLERKMVTPGLIDSHMHLSGVAFQFMDLNLTGVTSKKEMLEKIRERANVTPPEKWLTGLGFDENLFDDGGMPTLQELDEVAPHCPIFIKRICHHAFLVNSKALEMANYHPSMEVTTGGSVVLDPDTKRPTGLLLESASTLITSHIPEKTYDELKNGLALAMEHAMQRGLTSIHTNDPRYLGGLDQTYKMYDELLNQERKGLRCNLLIDHPFLNRLKERGMHAGYGNDTLQIGAIKIFADGALGGRTALLSEPYLDAPGKYGEAMHNQETLFQMVKEARDHSMPVAIHTIGDQAVENVLRVLDQFPSVKHRDRIIHVSLLREDLIRRLAKPTLIADIQPRFVVGDYPWVQDRLGKERIKYLYAWKSLLSAGVLCAGGSDAPVEPVDPLLGIHAAITQRHPEENHDGWNKNEKLSMREALEVFTIGGAYATNEEDRKGTIAPGKLADMTVYSRNLFEIEHPDKLLDTEIEMTIIGGEIVYRR